MLRISKTWRGAHQPAVARAETRPCSRPLQRISRLPSVLLPFEGGWQANSRTANKMVSGLLTMVSSPARSYRPRVRWVLRMLCWETEGRGLLRSLSGMSPFTPAVTMKPVRLEPTPEGGSADAERSGRFGQLPAVRVQRLDDSLLFPGCQCGGAR